MAITVRAMVVELERITRVDVDIFVSKHILSDSITFFFFFDFDPLVLFQLQSSSSNSMMFSFHVRLISSLISEASPAARIISAREGLEDWLFSPHSLSE